MMTADTWENILVTENHINLNTYYIQSEILSLLQGVLLLLPDDKLIVRDDDKLTCVSNDWHNDIMSASDKTIMDDHTRECP